MLKEQGAVLFTLIYKINTYTRREQFKWSTKGSPLWSGARPPFFCQWKNWEIGGTIGCIVKSGRGRQTTINQDGTWPRQRPSELKGSQPLSTTPFPQEPHPRQIFVRAKWPAQLPVAVDAFQSKYWFRSTLLYTRDLVRLEGYCCEPFWSAYQENAKWLNAYSLGGVGLLIEPLPTDNRDTKTVNQVGRRIVLKPKENIAKNERGNPP